MNESTKHQNSTTTDTKSSQTTTNRKHDDETTTTTTPSMTTNDKNDNNTGAMTKKAATGTIATIVLRIVSFGCTQYTYRYIADNPAILGSANITLELLLTTILFISREGFRLTFLSSSSSTTTTTAGTEKDTVGTESDSMWTAIAWCTVPVTTFVSGLALLWHMLAFTSTKTTNDNIQLVVDEYNDYYYAGIYYCIAACIEGYGEPIVLHALRELNVATKASAEGIAIIVKTASLPLILSLPTYIHYPVSAFGLSQICYSSTYTIFLYWTYRKSIIPLVLSPLLQLFTKNQNQREPKNTNNNNNSTMKFLNTLVTVGIFTVQGFIKHALTEGDRIVLTMLAGSYDQGVYAMGSSYGGLAARLLLQPLEENARLLWSRIVTTSSSVSSLSTNNNSNENENDVVDNNATASATKQDSDPQLLHLSYVVLVKVVLYIGFVFSCFGMNYTRILLVVLAGRKWGNNVQAAAVLSAFCAYTAFLAWNGMTEAFVYAVIASSSSSSSQNETVNTTTKPNHDENTTTAATNRNQKRIATDIGRLSIVHTIVGCTFAIVASIAVSWYGTVGLVFANCIAMFVRSIYSVSFAAQYFVRRRFVGDDKETSPTQMFVQLLHEMFPKPIVTIAFVLSFGITRLSLIQMERSSSEQSIETGSRDWYKIAFQHIGVGITCAIGVLTIASYVEYEFRSSLLLLWKGRSIPATASTKGSSSSAATAANDDDKVKLE